MLLLRIHPQLFWSSFQFPAPKPSAYRPGMYIFPFLNQSSLLFFLSRHPTQRTDLCPASDRGDVILWYCDIVLIAINSNVAMLWIMNHPMPCMAMTRCSHVLLNNRLSLSGLRNFQFSMPIRGYSLSRRIYVQQNRAQIPSVARSVQVALSDIWPSFAFGNTLNTYPFPNPVPIQYTLPDRLAIVIASPYELRP